MNAIPELSKSRRLEGRVALVTGAASGIGRATALRLAEEGARVVVSDLDATGVADTCANLPGTGHHEVVGDIAEEQTAERLASVARDACGRIDVLVTNAGMPFVRDVTDITVEEFDRVIAVNLRSMVMCCKHVIPTMVAQGSGSVVTLGSISAFTGQEDDHGTSQFTYNITKAAAVQLAVSLASRHARDGIRVNSVSPGVTNTGILRSRAPNASEEEYAQLWDDIAQSSTPLARAAHASEVANAILFLASDEASFVTGTNLVVDGGFLAR